MPFMVGNFTCVCYGYRVVLEPVALVYRVRYQSTERFVDVVVVLAVVGVSDFSMLAGGPIEQGVFRRRNRDTKSWKTATERKEIQMVTAASVMVERCISLRRV